MIDKKTLILAAAMVPMLGLADVGATSEESRDVHITYPRVVRHRAGVNQHVQQQNHIVRHRAGVNQHVQQQNHIVVKINGEKFSQYDSDNQTIMVDDVKCDLKQSPPIGIGFFGEREETFGDYLRRQYAMEAAELGLFDGVLDSDASSHCVQGHSLKWKEYLLRSGDETASFLGLYSKEQLGEKAPNDFYPDLEICGLTWGEQVPNDFYSYLQTCDLTWLEYLCATGVGENLSSEALERLYRHVLNEYLSENAMLVVFKKRVPSGQSIMWQDYIRWKNPGVAIRLGLFAKNSSLYQRIPDILQLDRGLQGVTWADYLIVTKGYKMLPIPIQYMLMDNMEEKLIPDSLTASGKMYDYRGKKWGECFKDIGVTKKYFTCR